jgi:hypothetical protein
MAATQHPPTDELYPYLKNYVKSTLQSCLNPLLVGTYTIYNGNDVGL